jgi:predicted nucleotidyltransferase
MCIALSEFRKGDLIIITTHQQQVLQAIVKYYVSDKRIRAVGLFGSLGRGEGDEYSDLDLDIVINDSVQIEIMAELECLCASLAEMGESAFVIVASASDAGDVVLASLLEFSIRYHTLETTNWKIVDSLVLLTGSLDLATIVAAGNRNRPMTMSQIPSTLLDRYLRYALGVSVQIRRHHLWNAIDLLHRMRDLLMQIYAETHGYSRPVHAFQQHAAPILQSSLATMLPYYELKSVCLALHQALTIVETDLSTLSNGQLSMSDAHHKLVREIRQRIEPCIP